jgi:hypothetical protein
MSILYIIKEAINKIPKKLKTNFFLEISDDDKISINKTGIKISNVIVLEREDLSKAYSVINFSKLFIFSYFLSSLFVLLN